MVASMSNPEAYHIPVMLNECLDGLDIQPNGIYVDVTFGGGGHSKAILDRLGPEGKLYAFDQDPDAAANAPEDPRFTLINQNFRYITNYLKMYRVSEVNGILADLGVSSHQFDVAERGFSLRFEGKLDMRMSQAGELSAFKVINAYAFEDLAKMFRLYGEITNAGKVAAAIITSRDATPISTTTELNQALEHLTPRNKQHQFLAKVYQAIRIEVNQEMEALESLLKGCEKLLTPKGRLVVMSYHSLEDRLVKNLMKTGNTEGNVEKDFFGNINRPFKLINNKPTLANPEEQANNSRSRSAKLRIAQKV